ncbi:MAG: glycosyltransferase [Mesorhizobium sp.]|uniref:glycosyltransferase family 2 protein n=2 Tax=Mesorhizobium TaxID=68287 RepID=UPI000F76318C|nr:MULTISPECIES: glycosyltransferase [unclassified Mesorhizobium]AZO02821.1 glycosyltransferase [Mesorhizobium sp. M2A.F.Ca.ET.043.02.1.1]RUW40105.1 glycosyltransferase [Mesorhizobium sp. M2A.F.Ca.ET.015.02.1.1]RUW75923.1 glycosyltransferase [Mesorhizobium sp. M2A.F.Ca.ET.067.02.1.1]RVC97677.1 glycosyltransferase [Mesorhizobium sp. M2A.F.Ca.ET.017.03.2.1]RWB43379.1 MAG: glycosyltransferase [Mesorhizobium sp.]
MEEVSIIIAAHNAAQTIARTLASLVSEKEVIGEVLVVDDCSSDATAAVATETALRFALPMRVIKSSCRDAGGSRNSALEQARCPWVYMIDADDRHLEGGLRTLLATATKAQPTADMAVGAFRRRADGEERSTKMPGVYTASGLANACAYLDGRIRSIAVGSALVSRRVIGETRFPVGLAYDEDTLFWARVIAKASVAVVRQPIFIYFVSAERSDDRFTVRSAGRFLEWRLALRRLRSCGIAERSLKVREGLVALKIARVHNARGDFAKAARFLNVAEAAPPAGANVWRCMRYRLKVTLRRRFSAPAAQPQRA